MENATTFDYVIVGGGLAGCVLANRLSSSLPHASILVIEAGKENDDRVKPSMGIGLGGAVISQKTGKLMGGSSAVNLQVWTRGAAADFDQWAEEVSDSRWSWANILPYFKKSESFYPGKDTNQATRAEIHGYDGPVKVTSTSASGRSGNRRQYPLNAMFKDVFETAGIPRNLDINSGEPMGFGEFANNNFDGERMWAYRCYPKGPNVTLWTETEAARLVFEGKRATGVEVLPNKAGHTRTFATKEVILSSGYKFSPKLLLLSGIGPKLELEKHSIPQVTDLAVGENYSDHPYMISFWKLRDRGLSLGDMPMVSDTCDWTAGIGCEWISFHRSEDAQIQELATKTLQPKDLARFEMEGRPLTETIPIYGHVDFRNETPAVEGSCFSFPLFLLAPESRGTVKLSSSSPLDALVVDPALFTNPLDEKIMFDCARTFHKAIKSSIAVTQFGAVEYGMTEEFEDDTSEEAMRSRLFRTGGTVWHGSGTCSMGSVVDTECKVKGVDGLRVVDASIFPFPLASHYQATVYAVAELMADVIAASF